MAANNVRGPCSRLPKSPLSRASASGGFRSLSSESSCGLVNSICWSKAGSSKPWGEVPRKATGAEGCGGRWRGCCPIDTGGCGLVALRGLTEEDVPGTEMERKSIWGRPKKYREAGLEFWSTSWQLSASICLSWAWSRRCGGWGKVKFFLKPWERHPSFLGMTF